MTGPSLAFLTEGLVATLLAATIVYCIILSRKLNNLKADQEHLGGIIEALNQATKHAETAIGTLRSTVETADHDLFMRLDAAGELHSRLREGLAEADGVLSKLNAISRAAGRRRDGQRTPAQAVRAELWSSKRLSSLAAADAAIGAEVQPRNVPGTGKDVA